MQKTIKNHYELLGIAPGASIQEIEKAYRRTLSLYEEDSIAVYSLYSSEERASMLKQITEAYATLTDKSKKSAYDSLLTDSDSFETREIDINAFHDNKPLPDETYAQQKHGDYQTIRPQNSYKILNGLAPLIIEQYRILFTKIEQISLKKAFKTFSITSAVKNEGKSTTSLHLAYVMATEFKKRTILVECDIRKPSAVLNQMENNDGKGLAELLAGTADYYTAIKRLEGTDLYVLPCGKVTNKSSEVLGLPGFKSLLSTLKTEFDYVIIDSPPILPLVDMNIISRLVDGVIVVIKAGNTSRDLVLQAVKSLSTTNMVGIVLNGADEALGKYYY